GGRGLCRGQTAKSGGEALCAASPRRDDELMVGASTFLSSRAFIGEAPLDTIKQSFGFERLSEKTLGADGDGVIVQVPVRKGGDEDYGCHGALFLEPSYEAKSAHSGHMNVGDDTAEKEKVGRRHKRFCRSESLGAITSGAHQIRQGRA